MKVPFRTLALFALALVMIGVGYLFAPAPGATPLPARPVAKALPAEAPKPVTTLVASRPPVPLVTPPRPTLTLATIEQPSAAALPAKPGDKPTVNMGTFAGNPPDANDKTQALAMQIPGMQPPAKSGDDAQARKAIEFDGYKNVRALEKGPDGVWRGRAMRGRTEIAIRVDANGNVSAE
jgi:hypothetical protein